MLINECKPEFQFKKSSKNVKFGQCLYLVAHLCYEQNRCAERNCNPSLRYKNLAVVFVLVAVVVSKALDYLFNMQQRTICHAFAKIHYTLILHSYIL